MEINSSTNFNSASNFQSNVGSGNGFNASSLASGSQSSFGGVDIQKLASSLVEALLTGNFFSLDGINPTPRGSALIANEIIKSINLNYKNFIKTSRLSRD